MFQQFAKLNFMLQFHEKKSCLPYHSWSHATHHWCPTFRLNGQFETLHDAVVFCCFSKIICLQSWFDYINRIGKYPRKNTADTSGSKYKQIVIFAAAHFHHPLIGTKNNSKGRNFSANSYAKTSGKATISSLVHNRFDCIRHFVTFWTDLHLSLDQLHRRTDKCLEY